MSRPIAIVAALPIEIAAARAVIRSGKRLVAGESDLYVGLVDPAGAARGAAPRTGIAAVVGMGERAVETSLARLFAEWNPAAVVMVGVAGGCAPDARAGDLFVCDPIDVEPARGPDGRAIEGRAPIAASKELKLAILRAAEAAGRRVRPAGSVTINVIASPRAKDSLHRNRDAAICDMETFWAARACAAAGVPFAALRAVFDGVADALPVVPGLGEEPIWGLVRKRPALLLTLPRLGLRMWKVRRALDPVVRRLVAEVAALP